MYIYILQCSLHASALKSHPRGTHVINKAAIALYACQYHFTKVIIIVINFLLRLPCLLLRLHSVLYKKIFISVLQFLFLFFLFVHLILYSCV
jgi:hypothetical protein